MSSRETSTSVRLTAMIIIVGLEHFSVFGWLWGEASRYIERAQLPLQFQSLCLVPQAGSGAGIVHL